MYFTELPSLNSIEAIMKQPPGANRRGGGRKRTPHKYNKKDCDCRFCLEHSKDGCTADICPVLDIRLTCGAASFYEAVQAIFAGARHIPFQKRLSKIYDRKDDSPVVFHNEHHQRLFEAQRKNLRKPDNQALAVLYPTLLSEDEFRQVQAIIASRRPREYMTPAETAIRNRVRCAECGRRFKRFAASAARVWWKCEEKECRTDFKITPDMLFHAIASLIDMVIDDPKLLTVPADPAQGFRPNTETVRVNHEINRLLEKPDADRQTLTSLILKGISVRYAACNADSAPYTTEKLKDAFAIAEPTGRIQPELIEKSVSAILVAHDGRIRIRFINGAVVSGRIEPRKERT